MKPTYADNGPVTTFEMMEGASIRLKDPMGIRFVASMSATDYQTLQSQNAEYGFIIAPSDWIDDKDDFKVGVMSEDTSAEKFMVRATATPQLDIDDYDKDGDKTEYVILVSFYGINEYNYSRPFSARAYYSVAGVPTHTENIAERAVYTVASKAIMVNGIEQYEEDDTTLTAEYEYFKGIIDKVEAKYTTVDFGISGEVKKITDTNHLVTPYSTFYVSVTATNPDTGRVLETGYRPYYGDATHYSGLYDWDQMTNCFVFKPRGEAAEGGLDTAVSGKIYGTFKFSSNFATKSKYTYWTVFNAIILPKTEAVGIDQDLGDAVTVIERGEVVENPNVTATAGDVSQISNNKKVELTLSYQSDNYEIPYSTKVSAYVNRKIEYGAFENEFIDAVSGSTTYPAVSYPVSGIKVGASESTALMIKDVELSTSETAETEQLVRFQVIPTNVGSQPGAIYGQRRIYVSLVDAEDSTNYVTMLISPNGSSNTDKTPARIGVRASNWSDLNGHKLFLLPGV